jgi:hypothetical protein
MKPLVSFILFVLVFNFSGLSQDKTFSFKGQVFYDRETLKDAIIEVYQAGDLVFETTSKGNGKFDFELKPEMQYTVEVSKENLRTKAIWINTKNTSKLKYKVPAFGFDVHLEDEEITPYDELSEIPVTLIKFQPKKEVFYMDKTYGNVVKDQKKKIKDNTLIIR